MFRLTCERFCYKVIRSYTFRATLPSNCKDVIRSYTFWLRSYTFPHTFRKTLLKVICSYTFRATLQLKCTNVIRSCTFLMRSPLHSGRSYVAATFRPPSCTLVAIGPLVLQRHLLLRSYTFLIRSYTFREALSLWDLLAPAAPGVDSGFWGTSHKT